MNNYFNDNLYKNYTNPFWIKYEDIIRNMSKEELNFVNKQESVILAKQNLISVFIDYLFEKEKNNFIAISEISKQVAENYLNEIQKASSNYVSKNEILENENAELKKRIEELLKIKEVKDVK
jgi:hypothetical protein